MRKINTIEIILLKCIPKVNSLLVSKSMLLETEHTNLSPNVSGICVL